MNIIRQIKTPVKYILHGAQGVRENIGNNITKIFSPKAKQTGNAVEDMAEARNKKLYGDLL